MPGRIVAAAIAVLLAGCATWEEASLPDGSKGYSIRCEGGGTGMNNCFQKAAELCGSTNFDITHRDQKAGTEGYSLLIKCRSAT